MSDCLFCKIVAGEIPATKVLETDEVLAFRDIDPKAPLHCLVIPKKHIASINQMTDADAALVGQLFLAARQIAADEGYDAAYRVAMNCGEGAGQSVFHMHLHVLAGRGFQWPPG